MPRRSSRPLLQLLTNLAKIGIPLLLIGAAAWWILNRDATPYGQLRVTTTIRGADIFVDGAQSGALSDTTLFNIPVGRRLVTVRAPGLISDPEVAIVEIQRDRVSVASFVMSDSAAHAVQDVVPVRDNVRQDIFPSGEGLVRSIPAAPSRRTMLDFSEADVRDYEYLATEPRSATAATATDVGDSKNPTDTGAIPQELRTALTGTQISVTSEPEGALIIVNGARTTHRTPYTFRGLDRGYYVISLELEGHLAMPDSIEVALTESGQSDLASFSLQSLQKLPVPQLTIQTKPLAAGIRVDGTSVGIGSARVNSDYGPHIIEYANVPGYRTPAPVKLSITAEHPDHEIVGTYERLSGSAMVAVVPNESFLRFDGTKLRVFVDNELILDGPEDSFDVTLLGSLYPGERAIRIQYEDLVAEEIVKLVNDQVAELTIRINAAFGKRALRFKVKTDIPLDKWQARHKRSNVLTQS